MSILTFDDKKTLSDFGMVNLRGNELPLKGAISTVTEKVPGRKGLLDFGNEIGSIISKYPIGVLTQNPTERSYLLRAFSSFISDEYGYPRQIKVHDSSEPDVYYWGKLRTAPNPTFYTSGADFILEIENIDGVKYSLVESDEILWGSSEINFTFDIELGHEGSGATNELVTKNQSFYPTVIGTAVQPFLVLDGSGTNVKIRCGKSTINVGNFTGRMEINTQDFYAELNGVEKPIRMDKFYLVPQSPLIISGENMNFRFTNYFRDEF